MNIRTFLYSGLRVLIASVVGLSLSATPVLAKKKGVITLIEMGDLHGTLVPHAAVLRGTDGAEYTATRAGGLAKLKKVVDGIRAGNPDHLLLSCGDLTHGSAEALFTVGDAMIKVMNAFDIDVFTPGNWDFGYGPAVFRSRFADSPPANGDGKHGDEKRWWYQNQTIRKCNVQLHAHANNIYGNNAN